MVPVGAQPLHDREAVAVGEHHVEHDEVGPELLGRAEGVGSVGGDLDAESFVPQGGCDEVGDGGFVVDDEDSGVSHMRIFAPVAVGILWSRLRGVGLHAPLTRIPGALPGWWPILCGHPNTDTRGVRA